MNLCNKPNKLHKIILGLFIACFIAYCGTLAILYKTHCEYRENLQRQKDMTAAKESSAYTAGFIHGYMRAESDHKMKRMSLIPIFKKSNEGYKQFKEMNR